MPITSLMPTAPSRAAPTTFSARMDAFLSNFAAWETQVNTLETNVNAKELSAVAAAAAALVSETNAAASAAASASYANATGTSAQSKLMAVGAVQFTDVPTGKSWVDGMSIVAYYDEDNYMLCTVTGYAGSTLDVNCDAIIGSGTYAAWSFFAQVYPRYPIFSAAAAALSPFSSTEVLENQLVDTGLGAQTLMQLYFSNSLFMACTGQSNANIATSADGITAWTLRAMPSTLAWMLGTNGTNKAVAAVASSTSTAKSTDMTTFSAGTALPGAAHASYPKPVFNGNTCMVRSNTASTVYRSSDNAATWDTQTTPTALGGMPLYVVNGLFWYYSATTVAYTSPTGATGDWTARTLPISAPNYLYQDFDGALVCSSNGTTVYRSTDGINWTVLPFDVPSTLPAVSINGVYAGFSVSLGSAFSFHNGVPILRRSNGSDSGNAGGLLCRAKNTAGTIFLIPNTAVASGKVIRIAPAEATGKLANFTR